MQEVLQPSTDSTVAIYATLRNMLLNYQVPVTGERVVDVVPAASVLVRQAPVPVTKPYIALLITDRQTLSEYNGYRESMMLRFSIMGRDEKILPDLEHVGDMIAQAFLGYVEPRAGLMFSRSIQRSTLPPFTSPADMQVVGLIMAMPLVVWPQYLTALRPSPQ